LYVFRIYLPYTYCGVMLTTTDPFTIMDD
jgi:hypothetical protein